MANSISVAVADSDTILVGRLAAGAAFESLSDSELQAASASAAARATATIRLFMVHLLSDEWGSRRQGCPCRTKPFLESRFRAPAGQASWLVPSGGASQLRD